MIVVRRMGMRGLGASRRTCDAFNVAHAAGQAALSTVGGEKNQAASGYAAMGAAVANMIYGVVGSTACAPDADDDVSSSSSDLVAAQQAQMQQQQQFQQQMAAQEAERRAREDASAAETKKIAMYVGGGLAVVVGGAILWKILA